MLKNVKCARCVKCGKEYEATANLTNCSCGGILDIIYDYDYIKKNLTKETLKSRPNTMWRYRELLPVEETTPDTPLRVGWSPLYEEPCLAKQLGLKKLWVKDDGQNPTASLKDRASAMAVAKAGEAGAKIIACSSTGNAASSLAGNAAAAGLKTFIFVPERAPKGKVAQLMTFGANVISVKGNYEETFELSKKAIDKWGWYNRNAAINPYLSEGKKTVSIEIAEQLDWKMPDYLAISVGDGCTIAGVWKGLKDLYAGRGLPPHQPRHRGEQALGADGGEHAGRLHRRRRAAQRGQGAHGHPRVERPGRECLRRRDHGGAEATRPHLRRVRRARRCDRYGSGQEGLRAGPDRKGRNGRLRRDRQRPEGRGERHQGLRRADLHPVRYGPAAARLRRARHQCRCEIRCCKQPCCGRNRSTAVLIVKLQETGIGSAL